MIESEAPLPTDPQRLMELLEARNRQINAVHTISQLLSSTLDLEERLRFILTSSLTAVDAAAGSILLHRPADDKLVFQYVVGEKADELTGMAMDSNKGIAGAVFQSGVADITNRPLTTTSYDPTISEKLNYATESIVTIPLKFRAGIPVGIMQILNKAHGEFNKSDLEVLEIVASVASVAIVNAQLARDAQIAAVAHAVGDLSHDIKNKVTPISLSVDTMRPMIEDAYHQIEEIAASAPEAIKEKLDMATGGMLDFYIECFDMIMDQVQEVQDYTKLIADALKGVVSEPQMLQQDLNGVVEKQIAMLDPVAKKANLTLIRDLAEMPECTFDRFLLERAVYNTVNNAIPETPSGGSITIKTSMVEEGDFPSGSFVQVEITDTGRGMPPHVLERILRGDAKSTKPGGTGLGTRIVYNAVLAHKGLFEGESHEGVGTTFRMKIPLHQELV